MTSLRTRFLAAVAALLTGVAAQARADERALAGRPRLEIPRFATAPTIDGQLDDEAWESAVEVTGLTQEKPADGKPATERTEFWLGYDSESLYVAAYAHYRDISVMRVNRSQRDRHERDDRVSIYLDTFLDQQTAYTFSVNGYGVQGDSIRQSQGGPRSEDSSWDALYETAGTIVDDGWIVEIRIPFKSIRYPARADGEEHRWGLQLHRSVEYRDEDAMWSPVSRDTAGFLTQFGVAYGLRDLSTSRNIELLPSFTGLSTESLDGSTGARTRSGFDPDAGVNVKYGVTSNLTLDAAFNPDFSQIESDRPQITVNQRFPIFFQERRPFFLEGQQIFSLDGPINLVHTRAIVDPRYGAKLTGKAGRTSLGVLVANDEGPGHTSDEADPAFGQSAKFFVGRARFDYKSESYVGAVVTDREFMAEHNRVAALDGNFKLSSTKSLAVMAGVSDDRSAEGLGKRGHITHASFNHNGRNLDWSLTALDLSPDFETDMGFIRRVDIRELQARGSWTWFPNNLIVSWTPRVQYERTYNYDGVQTDDQVQASLNIRFARNISARFNLNDDMERFGGIDFDKRRYSFGGDANFSSLFSFGGNWNWGDSIRYVEEPFLGQSRGGDVNVSVRPTDRLQASLNLNKSRFVDPRVDLEVFNVTTYRASAQYQVTDRLQLRQILEYNNFDGRLGVNLLLTYRVNAGTVAYLGMDDRWQRGLNLNPERYPTSNFERRGRAFFTKISYLFRY